MSNRAWVTLATNDSYGLGALVLAHSLRRVGSTYPAIVLITPSVTDAMRDRLSAVFTEVVTVDVLDSRDAAHLALLQRPELGITFTKIHCWNLTQYEKCVFLDADALVVQNCDELFEREELSAAPDVGWPDCFNSGVFVYSPSADTFNRLVQFAQDRGSFDGGDQGLLNSFFSDWAHGDINKHLPFLYNVTSAAFYSYMPALKHYGQNLKIIHFIGAAKPWLQHFNWESRAVDAPEHLRQFLQLWWDLFVADVHAQLDVSMVEVEALHDESTEELTPVLPPQDVSQHFHYQPLLDPLSEFPWHRPDAHIEKDTQEQQIDMSDVFDPWDIYGGHIHPNPEDLTSHRSGDKGDEQVDLRKYVWEYYGQDHVLNTEPHKNNESTDQIQQCDHRHVNTYQNTLESAYIHNKTTNSQHHTQHKHHKQFHNYQKETSKQSYNHHEHLPDQKYCHQEYLYNIDLQQDSFQQEISQECSIYTEQYDYLDHYPNDHSNSQQIHGSYEHIDDFQNQLQVNPEITYHDYIDHSQTQHIFTKQYEPNYLRTGETQKHDEQIYARTEHNSCDFELNTSAPNKQQNVEVYHVHVDTDRINNLGYIKESNGSNIQIYNEKVNGEASNSEDDLEDIIPRHPYDGFYLRHRVTIDSHGRKICTHEIPRIPSSSSSECSEAQEYFSAEETGSDFEFQSGVAGNLARVALDSSQREVIDELTRRQGWEAGNIDYMGVDSFDNIWAKISQTLSQARPSPPKQSPPRESAPPQTAPELVEVQTGEIAKEPIAEPVEVAKEVVPSEEAVTVQDPSVTTEVVSTKPTAHTTQTTVEVEPAIQSNIITPKEIQLETETSSPTLGADVSAVVPVPAPVSETPAETLPLTTVKPVSESVIATQPSATTEKPTAAGDLVPAEKVSEQALISKASATDKHPLTVTDAVAADLTSKTHEVNDAPAVIEALAPETPILVETKEKSEATLEEPITEPVKVPSSDSKPQCQSVQEVVKERAKVLATETIPGNKSTPATEIAPEIKTVPTTETVVAAETAPVEPVAVPVKVPSADTAPTEAVEKIKTQITKTIPVKPVTEMPKVEEPVQVAQAAPAKTPVCPIKSTPEKSVPSESATDSPPLANTPSKEEIPDVSAAKSAERRKPAGKLQLSPPVAADPLPTPDSELEDAAALAQSIIASELRTPTVTSPGSASSPTSPPALKQHSRLLVDEPVVPTPPVGAVSLTQTGVKTKGKTTTAAQIESSVSEKPESTTSTPTETTTQKTETAPAEVPKKKVVKKVVKKVSATGGDTPVPPPRKKEKKPKE